MVSDINAHLDSVSFINGLELTAGEAVGDMNEAALRRIQIREAVRAHFEKEQTLFHQGIKVLSLFFIDEVAKYRRYDESGEVSGEYARAFEEEYDRQLNEVLELEDTPYQCYLRGIPTRETHNGYFSIDKRTKRLVDPSTGARSSEAGDVGAYDRILKHKERLLSFSDPIRFIFSHSALREGGDNPNVFVICTPKHSDSTVSRRQEVGRGLRLAVNQAGERMDDPATVHQTNVLTVVASESYQSFVGGLQQKSSDTLSERPRIADVGYFTGKVLKTAAGDMEVADKMAKQIYKYLLNNDYIDDDDRIARGYHDAKVDGVLAPLPPELAPYAEQVFQLVDSVFTEAHLPDIGDDRNTKQNPLNSNFEKKEFQALWSRINRKAAYTVHFDSEELIEKCISALNGKEFTVAPLRYSLVAGEQKEQVGYDELKRGESFKVGETSSERYQGSIQSSVRYDLVGRIAEDTQLTRRTIAAVLQGINAAVFSQYRTNPEDFMLRAARLINEQKATVIVEHLAYNPTADSYGLDIFTQEKSKQDFTGAVKAEHHIYDYVFTDSKTERNFVAELDASTEVVLYAKLPKAFFIPTPVGNYNPDWAIAFHSGKVKHIYFIAETKGSMSSLELREIEKSKINCARKFFSTVTSDRVKYDVVNSYGRLLELVT